MYRLGKVLAVTLGAMAVFVVGVIFLIAPMILWPHPTTTQVFLGIFWMFFWPIAALVNAVLD